MPTQLCKVRLAAQGLIQLPFNFPDVPRAPWPPSTPAPALAVPWPQNSCRPDIHMACSLIAFRFQPKYYLIRKDFSDQSLYLKLYTPPPKVLCVESLQSYLTLCDPMDCSPPGSSVHGILQAGYTRVGCHALLQGIFPTQGSNPYFLCLLHREAGSLPLVPPRGGIN